MKIKLKTSFKCSDCNFEYQSAPWEPRWLARKAYEPAHAAIHDNPENHPSVLAWRKWEQERIIKLIEADCREGLGDHIQGCTHEVMLKLIKGENAND